MTVCLAALGFCLAGCTEEPVRVFESPRDKQRLLAAIVPAGDETWFFKLMGRTDSTTENADAFWKFVRSVRFPKEGPEPIAWSAPENWKNEPGRELLRYATFRIPLGQEVTVFRFGPQPEKVVENINRWRKQLKLPAMSAQDFEKIKKEEIDGHMSFLVDLGSARTDAIDVEAYEPRSKTEEPNRRDLPEFQVPDGWKVLPRTTGRMFLLGFQIQDGPMSVEITLTRFPGEAGGLAANVNRWREEVGLSVLSDAEAAKEGRPIEVDGIKSVHVDYSGANSRSMKKLRTLAVICQRGDEAWFIKMMGSPELVGKQQVAFESFVRSIRFGGGK